MVQEGKKELPHVSVINCFGSEAERIKQKEEKIVSLSPCSGHRVESNVELSWYILQKML
jgi:hypothetical protein